IAPGAGSHALVTAPRAPASVELRGRHDGAAVAATVRPVRIPERWGRAFAGAAPAAWVRVGAGAVAAITRPSLPAEEGMVRGQMDRLVVRNALSLAFLPRARACYLARPVKEARDFTLRGKLRLELLLDRGEVLAAVVKTSTLGRPEIEACLRDAAFGVE